MGLHSEPSLYSLTLGQIYKEKEKVQKGYYSYYITKENEQEKNIDDEDDYIGD